MRRSGIAVVLCIACSRPIGAPVSGSAPGTCGPVACERACEDGNVAACTQAAQDLLDGKGGHAFDAAKSLGYATRGCDGGDAVACALVGQHHENGLGVPWAPDRAVALYEKACLAGAGLGCFLSGEMYVRGHGVDIDAHKAESDRARALAAWLPACQGAEPRWCTYAAGLKLRNHWAAARELYQRACDRGVASGCVFLLDTQSAEPVRPGDARLVELDRLCSGGEPSACAVLSRLERSKPSRFSASPQIAALEQRRCELGEPRACMTTGILYDVGEAVSKDEERKLRYLGSACDRGVAEACLYLAQDAAASGRDPEAASLLQHACERGNFEACERVAEGRAAAGDDAAAARWATEGCRLGSAASCDRIIKRDGELPEIAIEGKWSLYRAACDDGNEPACRRLNKLDAEDEAIVRAVRDAIASQNTAAFARLAPGIVDIRGLWFDAENCAAQFSGKHGVYPAQQAALVQCLATLRPQIQFGTREHRPRLVHEPGVVISVDLRGGEVRGLLGPRAAAEAPGVAHVTEEALRAHASDTRSVEPDPATIAHYDRTGEPVSVLLQLCVDAAGKVTEAKVDPNPRREYASAVEAAARTWTFTPFAARGKPVPVCAVQRVAYPPGRSLPRSSPLIDLDDALGLTIGRAGVPINVASTTLDQERIAGERQIVPDNETKSKISMAHKTQLIGSFKLCMSSSGRIQSVKVLKPTGFNDYDDRLVRRLRDWRYRPFLVNGSAMPVCTAVTFVYAQH